MDESVLGDAYGEGSDVSDDGASDFRKYALTTKELLLPIKKGGTDPKDVLKTVDPSRAQEICPIYGPICVGVGGGTIGSGGAIEEAGGLYREHRNHELGHLKEIEKSEAIELVKKAYEAAEPYLEEENRLARLQKQRERLKENQLALERGIDLPEIGRKRVRNDDPTTDEFLGPWAPMEGEIERREALRQMSQILNAATVDSESVPAAPATGPAEAQPEASEIEYAVFNEKELKDYQGRSWIERPLGRELIPERYILPSRSVHTFSGHTKGVNRIKWFPETGHLLLSASMDGTCKIWNTKRRTLVGTYQAHTKAVKDITFTHDGLKFYSAGFDTLIKLWDTEYGKIITTFTNDKLPFSVAVHPDPNMQNVVLVACQNKKAIQYDANTGAIVQEYIEHLSAVNTATFCDSGKKIVTTSDDKKMFVWEFGIGVVVKHIAEPYMHAMPAVKLTPDEKYIACQSMDNQIVVYEAKGRFRLQSRRRFRGHMSTGYSILPGFSPDGETILSGDSMGKIWFWSWKSSKILRTLQAHSGVSMCTEWNPRKQSLLATCGWDGTIKLWE